MDSTALVTAVRIAGFIPDNSPDYTDSRIRTELVDVLHEIYEKTVVNARQGFWLQQSITDIEADQYYYRIPARAVTGGLEKLQAIDGGGKVRHLVYTDLKTAYQYENQGPGEPRAFVILGDQIQLLPKPSVTGWQLRFTYYIRPSALVATQTAGRVTAVNTTLRTITVNAIPDDQVLTGDIVSGTSLIDVVHPDGWHELSLVGATQTWATLTITVTDDQSMDLIQVGDYVRAAGQTDWPCLPDDFHRSLADAAAVVTLVSTGQMSKAQLLGSKVQSDIERLQDLIQPRVKDSPRILKPTYGFLRGVSGGRGVWNR